MLTTRLPATRWEPSVSTLRLVLVFHLFILVLIRLVHEADEFNNWDLISFLNANAFPSLRELLVRPEVHFTNPFSFPLYNTGAESVASTVMHRLFGHLSLYWSNVAVLLVYDSVFLAALYGLFRAVYGDAFLECVAWIFIAMSPILLTFLSISAYVTQGFVTLVVGLLGSECILRSRPFPGLALLLVAFTCISQAYGLTFFLPVFCLVWALARSLHRTRESPVPRSHFVRNLLLLVLAVAACTIWVEHASGGEYLRRLATVTADRHPGHRLATAGDLLSRVALLVRFAVTPTRISGIVYPGFAAYFMWLALFALGFEATASWMRSRHGHPATRTSATQRMMKMLPAAGWVGLVLLGYLPGIGGGNVKSQRCVFGDVLLAMAGVAFVRWLVTSDRVGRRTLLVQLLLMLTLADAYYLASVARVDHTRNHFPLFDFDMSDSVVRHDMIAAIERMRDQAANENAGLIVYYPRGYAENRTDPALFFGRFLRHFGRYDHRDSLIFPCRFCDVPYGCPFPEVGAKPCRHRCCYDDPIKQLAARRSLSGRRIYLWWYNDPTLGDQPRLSAVLDGFRQRYNVTQTPNTMQLRSWTCYSLAPMAGSS